MKLRLEPNSWSADRIRVDKDHATFFETPFYPSERRRLHPAPTSFKPGDCRRRHAGMLGKLPHTPAEGRASKLHLDWKQQCAPRDEKCAPCVDYIDTVCVVLRTLFRESIALRGEPPMPDRSNDAPSISRRTMLGAAAAIPGRIVSEDGRGALITRAKAWLAVDAETRRLMRRWGRLETQAVGTMDWFNMSDEERAATPFGIEMARIDTQLSHLFERRCAELSHLDGLEAKDFAGVAAKLVVATRLLSDEDCPAARIVGGALADMQRLGCSYP